MCFRKKRAVEKLTETARKKYYKIFKLIGLILAEQTTDNEAEASAIIHEIEAAKQVLSKSTKRVAFDTLIRIAAFCYKYSYKVGTAVAADVLVEIGKKFLTG